MFQFWNKIEQDYKPGFDVSYLSQNSTHDTSSKEEEAKTVVMAFNRGDIAPLTTGMAAGLSQFLT